MKIFAYYFRSESGDEYINIDISEKQLNVYEAMDKFGWDGGTQCWLQDDESMSVEDIPYAKFIVEKQNYL